MTLREQVIEFHRAFGQPISATVGVPDAERVRLRLRLVAEEFCELLAAMVGEEEFAPGESLTSVVKQFSEIFAGFPINANIVAIADALADLDYVIEGTRLEFGIDGAPIAAEVHRSNMAKLHDGKVIQREDGKIMKPANWTPPDIAGELRKQGWAP